MSSVKTWYTVRDIEKGVDLMFTINKKDVVKYLEGKRLERFRIDIVEYMPVQRNVNAKQFLCEVSDG